MTTNIITCLILTALTEATFGAPHYVDLNSPNPSPPYTNWATAARIIQDAVNAAASGDEVVVTNGIYASGQSSSAYGPIRVLVDKPLTLRSLHGAQFTTIDGLHSIRCVYLTNSASIVGFTLTNGFANGEGGGVVCDGPNALISNCVLVANASHNGGGGAFLGTLNNCTLTGNSAQDGGGALLSTLNNCALTGNVASGSGGGADECTLNNCTLTGNTAQFGGGASDCTLNNCINDFNSASINDNYDLASTLNYCCTTPLPGTGVGNIATDPELASPSHLSLFSPCRGAGNPASVTGTDIDGEPWANPPSIGCDEYHAGLATGLLSGRLSVSFTNVAAGFPVTLTALVEGRTTLSIWDFGDGQDQLDQPYTTHAWLSPGNYEVTVWYFNATYPDGVRASAVVHVLAQPVYYVAATNPNPIAPYTSWATAATNIQDAVDMATLPGALVLVTNGTYRFGGRTAGTSLVLNRVALDRPLVLRSVNGPQVTTIQGYQVPGSTNGEGAVRCLYMAERASVNGFTLSRGATRNSGNWPLYSESRGGGVCCASTTALVSNCMIVGNSAGYYGGGAYGGTLEDCVLSGNSAAEGGGACGSVLKDCAVVGNSAVAGGGVAAQWSVAAFGATLNNCRLTGNSASDGGASYVCALVNCALMGNSAHEGGAVVGGTLNNCSLTGNSADLGGGAAAISGLVWIGPELPCTLNNCILYFNTAGLGANYFVDADPSDDAPLMTLNYSCTTPLPTNGVENITNAPLFVDQAGGNLRLQSNSPCINAGNNAFAASGPDLDGNPRVVGGTVDIGAYEFQHPSSALSYAWLQQYGLPTDGSADFADPDGDGLNNWQEWRCGTDPTNTLSALRLLWAVPTGSNVTVTWQSVAGVNYFLERGTNLAAPAPFTPVAMHIPGQPGTTSCLDRDAPGQGPVFYRVGVR
jgi:hypothetical protein